jgi:hypothetical protein
MEGALMGFPAESRVARRLRVLVALSAALLCSAAAATPRDQAKRIHDRVAGVPADNATLDAMTALLSTGQPADALSAAEIAMTHPAFYRTVLKNFVTPWTNVERSVFAELNDYTATVIGIIRDERPFTEVLTADLVYVGGPGVAPVGYSHTDNDHYRFLEENLVELGDPSQLVPVAQSALPGALLGPNDAAGVITTRAAGEAFFSAGTNRRMFRFTAMNYLCRDLEQLKDVSRPADRIRQDVNRSPGGDSAVFHTECIGCHSGMDPMAGAFAYFEWDPDQMRVVYTPGQVSGKHLINANVFPGGYITTDDRWDNFWRAGPMAALGWRSPSSGGYGPRSFGQEIAESRAFSLCQVEKVFSHICFRPPQTQADAEAIERIATSFETGGYRMKSVFAEVAVHCMGQ